MEALLIYFIFFIIYVVIDGFKSYANNEQHSNNEPDYIEGDHFLLLRNQEESFDSYSNDTALNLYEEYLESIDPEMFMNRDLNSVNISYNRLLTLPIELFGLKKLHYLYMAYNHFKSIPEAIGHLTGLYELDIRGNHFEGLPESLSKLINLDTVQLDFELAQKLEQPLSNYFVNAEINLYFGTELYIIVPDSWAGYTLDKWKTEWFLNLDEEDYDSRFLLIKAVGYERILNEMGALLLETELDEHGKEMKLYHITEDIDLEPVHLLQVECPSTGHKHVLRVPPDILSCEQGRRWTLFDNTMQFKFTQEA